MMDEKEVFEYAKTHPAAAIGISRSAFEKAGVDPASLIGKSNEEQRRVIHAISAMEMMNFGRGSSESLEPQGTAKPTITPEEHALNEALLEKLTAELGRSQRAYLASLPPEEAAFYREVEQVVSDSVRGMQTQIEEKRKREARIAASGWKPGEIEEV